MGHILYDPLGNVLSNTIPLTLSTALAPQAAHSDELWDYGPGVHFAGGRYYDSLVGGYVAANPFGGVPSMSPRLNRFGAGSGLGAGSVRCLVEC